MSVGDILERDEDRPAYVRFERRAVKDNEATLREGHYVSKDEDYALVTPPYSKDCVIKTAAKWFDYVKKQVASGRVPMAHQELWEKTYARWQDGQEPPVDGTSIKDWNAISPAQCQNLINAGCRTIEDLAVANDEAMRRLGMGANDLKNKAKAWLQAAKDHGPLTEEVTQLKNQNKQLKGTIESLQEQIKRLEIRVNAQDSEDSRETPELYDPFNTAYIASKLAEPQTEESKWKPGQVIPPSEVKTIDQRYFEKFGKKPDGRWTDATILKKLQE